VARERPTVAPATIGGVTTGERAAMQVRSRLRANAGRETGVREIGKAKLMGWSAVLPSNPSF